MNKITLDKIENSIKILVDNGIPGPYSITVAHPEMVDSFPTIETKYGAVSVVLESEMRSDQFIIQKPSS